MKLIFKLLIVSIIFSLLPLGTSVMAKANTEDTLVIWHAYRDLEKKMFEGIVDNYNKRFAKNGVKVKSLSVPYDAYADKITAAVPRGKGPDLFIFAQDRLGGWVESGNTIESIDFYVDDELKRRFLPGLLNAMVYDDTIYGLPFNYKSIILIYNKKLIKSPPRTMSDLIDTAKKLTDKKAGRYGFAYSYSDFFYHATLMNAFGGQVFDNKAKPTVNMAQNVQSFEKMLEWYRDEKILPSDPSTALITTLFNEEKAAMIFSGPWTLGEINPDIDYGLAVLPSLSQQKPLKPWLAVEGIYLSAASKNKEKAFEFAKFLVSTESALAMSKGKQLPSNRYVYQMETLRNNPRIGAFSEQFKTAVAMPNYLEMTLMWSPMTTAMNKVIKGSLSPKAALDEAQAKITDDILALRKGK